MQPLREATINFHWLKFTGLERSVRVNSAPSETALSIVFGEADPPAQRNPKVERDIRARWQDKARSAPNFDECRTAAKDQPAPAAIDSASSSRHGRHGDQGGQVGEDDPPTHRAVREGGTRHPPGTP
jgi:hypothetical protein